MKCTIIAIGFNKDRPLESLIQNYLKRIIWPIDIIELDFKKKSDDLVHKKLEGQLILNKIPERSYKIALDESGTLLSSIEFAQNLERQSQSYSHVTFIIGGSDGLCLEVKKTAHFIWSLSTLTFPHMLVRPILIEQIYRAQQIINSHPYHKV